MMRETWENDSDGGGKDGAEIDNKGYWAAMTRCVAKSGPWRGVSS